MPERSPGDIKAGGAYVSLGLDFRRLVTGLVRAEAAVSRGVARIAARAKAITVAYAAQLERVRGALAARLPAGLLQNLTLAVNLWGRAWSNMGRMANTALLSLTRPLQMAVNTIRKTAVGFANVVKAIHPLRRISGLIGASFAVLRGGLVAITLGFKVLGQVFRGVFAIISGGLKAIGSVVKSVFSLAVTTVRGFIRTLSEIPNQLRSLGIQIGILGAIIVAPFIKGIKSAAAFSDKMGLLATVLGDQADKVLPQMEDEIRKLSIEFGTSVDDIADAVYRLLQSLYDSDEALVILRKGLEAAKAGGSDLETGVRGMVALMRGFDISAKEAGEVADILFTTVRRGSATFEELSKVLPTVAASANAAGISAKELAAAFSTVTRKQVPATIAATALRNVLLRFLIPSNKKAAELAKKQGAALETSTLKTLGLVEAFKRLGNSSETIQAQVIPNIRAIQATFPIFGDLEGLARDMEAQLNTAGASAEAFGRRTDTLAFDLSKVGRAIEDVFLELGKAVEDPLRGATESFLDALAAVKKFIRENKELILTVFKVGITLTGLGISLFAIGSALKLVGSALSAIPVIAVAAAVNVLTIKLAKTLGVFEILEDQFGISFANMRKDFRAFLEEYEIGGVNLLDAWDRLWIEAGKFYVESIRRLRIKWANLWRDLKTAGFGFVQDMFLVWLRIKHAALGMLLGLKNAFMNFWDDQILNAKRFALEFAREIAKHPVLFFGASMAAKKAIPSLEEAVKRGEELNKLQKHLRDLEAEAFTGAIKRRPTGEVYEVEGELTQRLEQARKDAEQRVKDYRIQAAKETAAEVFRINMEASLAEGDLARRTEDVRQRAMGRHFHLLEMLLAKYAEIRKKVEEKLGQGFDIVKGKVQGLLGKFKQATAEMAGEPVELKVSARQVGTFTGAIAGQIAGNFILKQQLKVLVDIKEGLSKTNTTLEGFEAAEPGIIFGR